jgi:hypothetical protein
MDRKVRFGKLLTFITERGGWVTSISGAPDIVFECLPLSPLPNDLRDAGYTVTPADPPETTRIIAGTITEKLTLTSCGAFEALTEGSTKPVAEVRRHHGIVRTRRYAFSIA